MKEREREREREREEMKERKREREREETKERKSLKKYRPLLSYLCHVPVSNRVRPMKCPDIVSYRY